MLNIGPVAAGRLREVGISTPADLQRAGAVRAFRRLRERFPDDTTPVALYALQGALLDVRWDQLPKDLVEQLRQAAGTTRPRTPTAPRRPQARHRRR
jgi:DNA transformation protein